MALERIVRHCLEKRPEDRFQSARDLVFALEAVAQAGAADAPGGPPRRGRRMRLAMVAGVAVLGLLAVGVAVRNWFAHGIWNPRRTAPMKAVPLTSLSGWEWGPALSPDGSQLAFSWDSDGDLRGDIYVQLIGAGTPLRLTTDPEDDFSPAWSPDGRHIAFFRWVTGGEQEIFTVPALGGPERKLQANHCGPWGRWRCSLDWSPDGGFLAFPDRTSTDRMGIFLLSVETLEQRRLTVPPGEHEADVVPAFSPDGRWVAFGRVGTTTKPGLYVVPVAGGEPRRVSLGEVWTRGEPTGQTWTPDGDDIMVSWSLMGSGFAGSLWRVPATGGAPQEVALGGDTARRPSISRRGNRLAFMHEYYDADTWEIGVSGSPPRGHSPTKVISSSRLDLGPQLSPDGSKIAFESDRSGSGEIWICDRDGTNALQLTRFGAVTGTPRWSPDGRRLAFDSDTKETCCDVYVLEVAGGPPRRLTLRGRVRRRAELVRRRPVDLFRLEPHGRFPGVESAGRRRSGHPGDQERRLRRFRVAGRQPTLLREVRRAGDLERSGQRG